MARTLAVVLLLASAITVASCTGETERTNQQKQQQNVLQHTVKDIDGNSVYLAQRYGDKILLIVNVASKCGYTPQYEGLRTLYDRYREKGFEIAAFPANNFMNQEPGSDAQIKEFCSRNFRVKFDMYSKISVKGADKHPLYKELTDGSAHSFGGEIKWNFTKFLVVNGKVVARYEPPVKPLSDEIVSDIENALKLR
ncbi:MAG: glutathione peroxidase [Planctomycetota bacterium]|nr:glutathione peroxidase [Planctomycetota bacterium]